MIDIGKIKPARGLVLVRPNPRAEVSAGGVIIPEFKKKAKDKGAVTENGVVVQRGAPYRHKQSGEEIPWEVQVGQTVWYGWMAGTEVKTDQGVYLLLLGTELVCASC